MTAGMLPLTHAARLMEFRD